MLANLLSSKSGWSSLATAVVWLLTNVVSLVPQPWGNVITAVLGVLAFYHIGNTVGAARSQGAKV